MKTALGEMYCGRLGTLEPEPGISVRVGVMDAKRAFGRLRLLVTPINGTGEKWVSADRVTLDPDAIRINLHIEGGC